MQQFACRFGERFRAIYPRAEVSLGLFGNLRLDLQNRFISSVKTCVGAGFVVKAPQNYKGVPFFDMSPSSRGKLFEGIAKEYDRLISEHVVEDPEHATDVNGKPLGQGQEKYDWLRHQAGVSQRVEAKSSSFSWDMVQQRWVLHFSNVKAKNFDQLMLIVYAPWGLELWQYKDVALQRTRTEDGGKQIRFYGPCGEGSIVAAWQERFRPRMQRVAEHIVSLDWQHPLVWGRWQSRWSRTVLAFDGVPLSKLSPSQRGYAIQHIVCRYERAHSSYTISIPERGKSIAGTILGWNQSAYDWLRHGDLESFRVEVKHSSICWDITTQSWRLAFAGIKFQNLDNLVLVAYAPWGLEIWEYDVAKRRNAATAGKLLHRHGSTIAVRGPVRETNLRIAWQSGLLARLQRAAKHITTLTWCDEFLEDCLQQLELTEV